MRKITLTGRIVADAQKNVTPNGHEYVTFRLGNNEFNDEKGTDGRSIPYWFRVTSWNHAHLNLVKYLTKGKPVIVVGNYKDSIYQNNKTGNCEISRDITVDSIEFISDGSSSNSQNNSQNNKTTTHSKPQQTTIPEVTSSITATNYTPNNSSDDDDDLPF